MPDTHMDPLRGFSQRLPPSNLQAEQALLGAILANNRAYPLVAAFLRPEHFVDAVHGRIYQAIARRISAGKLVDAVTLKTEFENTGILAEVGGIAYLSQLLSSMVGIINAGEYGHTIHDTWLRRQLIDIGEGIVNNAFGADPDQDGEGVARSSIEDLLDLAQSFAWSRGQSFAQALDGVLDAADAAHRGEGKKGLLTGISTLDDIWGGLWPGFDVVGARSSHGKTVLGMQIAEGVAERLQDGRVQVFSLEMPNADLALRMLQSRTGVSADTIRSGKIGSVAGRLAQARADILALPLDIIDTPALSITDISTRAKADKKRLNTKLIVIDHLHRIAPPAHMAKSIRLEQVRYVAAALKDLSGDLGIPIICLAQLSADVERRPDHRPRISDIEYLPERDADNILLLWRPSLYIGSAPIDEDFKSAEQAQKAKEEYYKRYNFWKGKAEAILAKRRFGASSHVVLGFDENSLRFTDQDMVG